MPPLGDRATDSRATDSRGLAGFHRDDLVRVTLPVLKMATELGGQQLAATLKRGDLLRLGDPHPQGSGQVFWATVVKTADGSGLGRVGIVRTNWIEHAVVDIGGDAPKPVRTPTAPSHDVLHLPVETYVDNYKEVIYDPDYRREVEPTPTNWLRAVYDDGTEIDLHFSRIADKGTMRLREALVAAKLGDGGRVFPAELNEETTPRLWAAKQKALEEQATLTLELMKGALIAVMFVITMPPMPVGRPPGSGGGPRPTSRRVQGSLSARATPRAARLAAIRATRLSVGQLREEAQALVRQLRNQGKPVVVNLGGAGAPHEPVGAINVNKQVPGTERAIPNLVKVGAEEIGSLFASGQVDEIVGFRLSPKSFNWGDVAKGAFRILKGGGKISLRFQGADHGQALELARALQEAGFVNLEILADAAVIAVRP